MRADGLLLAAALLVAAPAADQPVAIEARGDWTQPATGQMFPAAVAEFRRVNLSRYDEHARDVSAGYVTGEPPAMLATIYVYPMPGGPQADAAARARACQAEFTARQREITQVRRDANLLRAGAASPPERIAQGRTPQVPGFAATYSYMGTMFGEARPLVSELHVFCHVAGAWVVKYRLTAPDGPDAGPLLARFMASLRWTIRDSAR
jgi:hypothetical protein